MKRAIEINEVARACHVHPVRIGGRARLPVCLAAAAPAPFAAVLWMPAQPRMPICAGVCGACAAHVLSSARKRRLIVRVWWCCPLMWILAAMMSVFGVSAFSVDEAKLSDAQPDRPVKER